MKDRIALEYFVLDVFSNKSYKGNPLSVVFTDGDLALESYHNIAKEFGYSETSFIILSLKKRLKFALLRLQVLKLMAPDTIY